jgi:hypothetical protein
MKKALINSKISSIREVYPSVTRIAAIAALDKSNGDVAAAKLFLARNPDWVAPRLGENLKISRIVREPAAPVVKPFFEAQRHLLCGQHALNHVLQEPKYVWMPDEPLYINGDDPLTKKVKINIWNFCGDYEEAAKEREVALQAPLEANYVISMLRGTKLPPVRDSKRADGTPDYGSDASFQSALAGYNKSLAELRMRFGKKTDAQIRKKVKDDLLANWELPPQDICDFNLDDQETTGMIPILALPQLLSLLRYDSRILDRNAAADLVRAREGREPDAGTLMSEFLRLLEPELVKANCLGVLFNKRDPSHWTAIVKHNGRCVAGSYSYVDSMFCKTVDHCGTVAELKALPDIAGNNFEGAVFVYRRADSYRSRAVELAGAAGGTRRLRQGRRRSTRRHR